MDESGIRLRLHYGYVLVDGAVTLLWIDFQFAFFYPQIAFPGTILLLLVLAIVWTVFGVRRELQALVRERDLSHDPELSPGVNLWVDRGVEAFGVVIGILLGAPALVAAIAVVSRAW